MEKLVELESKSAFKILIHAGQIIELGERSKSLINKVNTATKQVRTNGKLLQISSSRNNNYCRYNVAPVVTGILEIITLQMGILLEKFGSMQQLVWLK